MSKNIVVVSSKARQSVDVVRTRVWTGTRELAGPVPVYTRLSVGSSPVLGARVYLDVEVENSNGTVFVLLPSLMLDNGHGEPDMTGDDGESFNPIPPVLLRLSQHHYIFMRQSEVGLTWKWLRCKSFLGI